MKFNYRDKIRVASGFYKGCIGFVDEIDEVIDDEYDKYYCELYASTESFKNRTFAWLPENILEKIG